MRWRDLRRSSNVEDGRGGGGARRMGIGGGGVGLLVLAVAVYFIGGPEAVMQLLGGQSVTQSVDQAPGVGPGQPDEASAPRRYSAAPKTSGARCFRHRACGTYRRA
jgi:predicted metalloprotease